MFQLSVTLQLKLNYSIQQRSLDLRQYEHIVDYMKNIEVLSFHLTNLT